MLRTHHIHVSRALAFTIFMMALVLTPRAWVEPKADLDLVPVETLDQPSQCLWCEPEPEPCREAADIPVWLNPDQPVPAQDCIDNNGARTPSRS